MREILAAALLLPALALAQAQSSFQTIGYQGQLKKSTGEPERLTTTITFRIYKEAHGGTALWDETHDITPNAGGFYAIFLGSTSPEKAQALAAIFDGGDRYLELQITGEDPLSPRQQIASVPYALTAKNVKGGPNDTVTTGSVNAGSVKVSGPVTATGGVTGLPTPTGNSDAATMEYVDRKFPISTNSSNIQLTGPNPASSSGFSNTLTPSNIVKAWAQISIHPDGRAVVQGGYNISGASWSGEYLTVTFATAMHISGAYAPVVTLRSSAGDAKAQIDDIRPGYFTLRKYAGTAGASWDTSDIAYIVVAGLQ